MAVVSFKVLGAPDQQYPDFLWTSGRVRFSISSHLAAVRHNHDPINAPAICWGYRTRRTRR